MSYRQAYQGSPELKQYAVINDFSGGINTTDVDDVVRDNEFRMLQNIELGEAGLFQNRKGFVDLELLNDLLSDQAVTIPTGNIQLLKVVKDTYNTLEQFKQFDDLAEFVSANSPYFLQLHILMVVSGDAYILKVEKVVSGSFTATISSLGSVYSSYPTKATTKHNRVVSPETVDYLDFVYFLGSTISPEGEGNLYKYDIVNATLTRYTGITVYKPTPYEVTSATEALGFNVLADSPLTYVTDQETGIKAVLGMFLTDTGTGAYLDKIPADGIFTLNVITTGISFSPYELTPVFKKDATETELSYILGSVSVSGGILHFRISSIDLSGVNYVMASVKKATIFETFTDINKLYPFQGISAGNYFTETTELYIYRKGVGTLGYLPTDFTKMYALTNSKLVADVSATTFVAEFGAPETFGTWHELYDAIGGHRYAYYDDYIYTDYFVGNISEARIALEKMVPPLNCVVKVNTYFYRLGAKNGELADFTNYEIEPFSEIEDIVMKSNTLQCEIGVTTNATAIQKVDLKDARMVLVSAVYNTPRMLFYKGNTLWFSEIGQFDYLPNRNFVIIPLESEDVITSVNYYRNNYIVFTKSKIFKIVGDFESSDFKISLVNNHIGCVSPYSVRGINNSLAFISQDGMYRLTNNYYTDELENVSKIDKKITGLVKYTEGATSLLFNEQYFLFLTGNSYDTLRYYYNKGNSDNDHPYVVDKYASLPDALVKAGTNILTLKSGKFYLYGYGFTDFAPADTLEEDIDDYTYLCRMVTSRLSLGYPTHDKKFKSIFIKTYYNGDSLLYITALVDDFLVVDPKLYKVVKNTQGGLEYVLYVDPAVDSTASLDMNVDVLGEFELGNAKLGDSPFTVHKVTVGSKGKMIQLMLEQKSNGNFGVVSIGFLHKLGKVKESR